VIVPPGSRNVKRIVPEVIDMATKPKIAAPAENPDAYPGRPSPKSNPWKRKEKP